MVAKASSILVRVDDLIDNDLEDTDLVLTKEGSDYIERYKERKAQDYVDHVCRCTKCDLIDVCYKLTKNFLMLVKLERLFQE